MFRLVGSVTIGSFKFEGLNNLSFTKSWEELTSQGTLNIPRNLQFQGKPIVSEGPNTLFKRGDKVTINAGYFPNQFDIFKGFVSDIKPTTPIEFKIEDYFWLLKQVTINKVFRSVNLSDLLSFMLGELKKSDVYINANVSLNFESKAELTLTNFRINRATIAEVFNKLREYGLYAFFREETLYCGLAAVPKLQKEVNIQFEELIISDTLIYNKKDDQKIKLVAVSINLQNEKTEVIVGDKEGEQRTFYYYNLSESDLKAIAERELERVKYEGYKGDFTTFGTTYVNHGDIINLTSTRYPYRNGKYLVKSNAVSVGFGGYRQVITLDQKIQ